MSEAKTTKINKKVILIGILVVILVVAVVIVYTSVIAPAMKKNNFIKEHTRYYQTTFRQSYSWRLPEHRIF